MMISDILNTFSKQRILVTGGTGMIGRQVVHLLCDAGAKVLSVSLDDLVVDDRAEHIRADLREFSVCVKHTKGLDAVCHIAGVKGGVGVTKEKPASSFVPLLMMNTNVLEAARRNNVPKLVYTSTIGTYESAEILREEDYRLDSLPMDGPPGWAKRMAELQIEAYFQQYGISHYSAVRPTNVYGPGDNFDPETAMVIPSLMHRIASGEDPLRVWGDGSAVRDFAYSRDIAEGILRALHYGTGGQFVNLGSGSGVSIRELVETLQSFLGFRFEFDAAKPSGFPKRVMDIEKARTLLGYSPKTSLQEGLQRTWEWYREHKSEHEKKKNYFAEQGK